MTTEMEKLVALVAAWQASPDELIMNADDAISLGWAEEPCAYPECPIYGERHCHIRRVKT